MDRGEFNKWFSHFTAAFPAVKEFVCRADLPGEKAGTRTLGLWFGVLKDRELSDALAVTNGMFEGVLDPVPGSEKNFPDWSSTPRHVCRLISQMHPVVPEWRLDEQRAKKARQKYVPLPNDYQATEAYLVLCRVAAAERLAGSRSVGLAVHEFHERWFPRDGRVPIEDAVAAVVQLEADARASLAIEAEYNGAPDA